MLLSFYKVSNGVQVTVALEELINIFLTV